jgi:hypothetical protein
MTTWACPGCGATCDDNQPDQITGHVQACDYVDGTGQPPDLTVKFSATAWYITTVRAGQLAAATGGLPFTAVRGPVEDGFADEDTEDRVTEFLASLSEGGPAEMDGWEIGDICPARLDGPSAGTADGAREVVRDDGDHSVYEIAWPDGRVKRLNPWRFHEELADTAVGSDDLEPGQQITISKIRR